MNDLTRLTVTGFAAGLLCCAGPMMAAAQPIDSKIPPSSNPDYPDGVSPTHVYAKFDLVDRCVDKLIDARNVPVPTSPREVERDLRPMHVYQTTLTCTRRLQELGEDLGVLALPTITAKPRVYHPRDVYFIVNMMLENVRRIAAHENITDLPTEEVEDIPEKVPTDVFNTAVKVFVKLNALCGHKELSPSEVYAEMARAAEDVRSMLRQADPACRYKINAPSPDADRRPGHVFRKCLEIREKINELRVAYELEPVPVPEAPPIDDIEPRDVFFQTQIIIAELNLLKKPLDTISSTPLPIPVSGKEPSDVYGRGEMVLYLLDQVKQPETTAAVGGS